MIFFRAVKFLNLCAAFQQFSNVGDLAQMITVVLHNAVQQLSEIVGSLRYGFYKQAVLLLLQYIRQFIMYKGQLFQTLMP